MINEKIDKDIALLTTSANRNTNLVISCEECAELQKEITKLTRDPNRKLDGLIEEMADVYICLGILAKEFNIPEDRVISEIEKKMKRNIDRMEKK